MTFTMLVGIAGIGKSTYAQRLFGTIVSSDAIRGELYGDESVQTNPGKVFNIMKQRTFAILDKEGDVIYDATNLKRKNRVLLLNELRAKYGNSLTCRVIVFPTDVNMATLQNKTRERKVPQEVIIKQARQLQIPTYDEGWDIIVY